MENLALLWLDTNNVAEYSWIGWFLFGAFALVCLVVLFFVWCFHYSWRHDRRERRRAEVSGIPSKSFDEKLVDAFRPEQTPRDE
jgi:hypothetical protein